MSKDRAARRAARELDRIQRISSAQERHAAKRRREENRERRRERLSINLRPGHLAARRRARMRLVLLVLIVVNGAIWLASSSGYLRFGAILVSLLIMPIVRVLIVDSRR